MTKVIQEWTDEKGWIHRIEIPLKTFLREHDFEAVVRCKDCLYYGEHTNYIKGKFCIKHSHLNDDFMFHCGEDDYCIWGERRKDETN